MDLQHDLIPADTFAREILRACPRTEKRLRARREGPPYIRLGRRVFYRKAAIEAWLLAQEQSQPRANKSHQ